MPPTTVRDAKTSAKIPKLENSALTSVHLARRTTPLPIAPGLKTHCPLKWPNGMITKGHQVGATLHGSLFLPLASVNQPFPHTSVFSHVPALKHSFPPQMGHT